MRGLEATPTAIAAHKEIGEGVCFFFGSLYFQDRPLKKKHLAKGSLKTKRGM